MPTIPEMRFACTELPEILVKDRIIRRRQDLIDELAQINSYINAQKSKTITTCMSSNYGAGCGAELVIGDLTYLQTHWYEPPYGCTGGDNWHPGEGNFVCPHCGQRNRLYNRQDIQDLKYHFKNIEDIYED